MPPINSLQIQPCSESESRSEFIHCIHACTPTSWPDLDPCDLPTSMPLLEVGIYLCIAVTFQKRQIQHDVNKKSYWSWSLGHDCSGRFRSRFGYLKRRKVLIFWKWHVKAVPGLVIIFLKQIFFLVINQITFHIYPPFKHLLFLIIIY